MIQLITLHMSIHAQSNLINVHFLIIIPTLFETLIQCHSLRR